MPNPKWRHSKRRKRARRTHYKSEAPNLATCATTGEKHLLHHAYWVEDVLYYRGKILVAPKETAEAS